MSFQICEKMALIVRKITLKNIILKDWTSMGYILATTHFVTQFTPVSRHPKPVLAPSNLWVHSFSRFESIQTLFILTTPG